MARLSTMIARLSLSLRVQLLLLAIVSLTVPVLLYGAFQGADRDKDVLVLDAVRGQDVVIAKALAPLLSRIEPADYGQLPSELARFATADTSLKLLYKPNADGGEAGFFYIASAPTVPAGDLEVERQRLVDLGVLDRLATSCDGDQPLSERVQLPDEKREMLTSVAPLKTDSGCWVLVVAAASQSLLGEVSDLPYWERPPVRAALMTYAGMAVLVVIMFGSLWLTFRRFRRVARDVEAGRSFSDSTQIPELASMAADFDRMVARLNDAAALLRRSAEDNAHAFKTPVAIIRQALEMVRRPIGPERMKAAFDAIEASLAKLDGLIRSARRLDVATADSLETARHSVDLSSLVEGFAAEHALMNAARAERLVSDIEAGIAILGREELVETILENLVDNADSFSPPDGRVFLSLSARDGMAVLSVADQGPGVAPDRLANIFERYYSQRPRVDGRDGRNGDAHYGVGLWIVRQNASVLGGQVMAANRPDGGFVVTVALPLARGAAARVQTTSPPAPERAERPRLAS